MLNYSPVRMTRDVDELTTSLRSPMWSNSVRGAGEEVGEEEWGEGGGGGGEEG